MDRPSRTSDRSRRRTALGVVVTLVLGIAIFAWEPMWELIVNRSVREDSRRNGQSYAIRYTVLRFGERAGVRDGGYVEWYPDRDHLAIRGRYRDGKKQGVWTTYDASGRVYSQARWEDGRLVATRIESPWWGGIRNQRSN